MNSSVNGHHKAWQWEASELSHVATLNRDVMISNMTETSPRVLNRCNDTVRLTSIPRDRMSFAQGFSYAIYSAPEMRKMWTFERGKILRSIVKSSRRLRDSHRRRSAPEPPVCINRCIHMGLRRLRSICV